MWGGFYPNATAMPTPEKRFLKSNLKKVGDGESAKIVMFASDFRA
jgi:hypothetical protein